MDSFKYPLSPSEGVEEKLGLFRTHRTNSDGDRNIFSENVSNQQYFHPKFMTEVTIKNAQMVSTTEKDRAHTPPMTSMTSPTITYWNRAPASMKDSQNDIINEIDLDGDKLTPALPKKSNSARTGELRSRVSDFANENEGIARKDSIMDSIKKSVRSTVRQVSRTMFRGDDPEKPASLKAIQLIHDKAASPAEYRSEVSFSKKRRKKVVPRFKQALQKHANYKVDVGSQALFRLWKDVQKIKQSRFGRIKYRILKLKGLIQLRDYDLWRRFKRLFRIREPEGLFRICWDILCMLIIILDLIGLPVLFTFEDAVDRTFGVFDVIDNVQAIFFIIDIVLNFNTAYYSEGELIMDRKSIARNYIRGWFWIDLVCALPFDALAQTVQDFPDTFDRLKRIKMVRMLRVAKLRKILLRFEEYLGTSRFVNGILSLVNLSMVISFLAHWSACIWYAIGQANDRMNWLMEGDFEHGTTIERYVVSLYFAMTTMMTVGYGDIVPSNMGERIYTICLMLVGGGVFGYTMNSIGLILQSLEDEKSKVRRKIYSTSRFMNQQGVNKEVQSEVRKYLEFVLDNEAKSKSAEREMLGLLPPRLHNKVNEQLNRKFVTGNTILMRIFNQKTVQMIASRVEEKVFGVEETVFDTTDTEMSIFYIVKGTVGIYHPRSALPLFALKKGLYFGERSFFSNLQRTIVAKSHDFSQLLYFRREPLLEILQSFPLDKEMFHMVKDSVAVYEDYSALDLSCHICGKKDHVEETCPNIHYVPDKTEIIEEYLEECEGFMQDYQRKPRKKFHARSNLPRVYEAVHRMRNLPVVQGDMSMPEDSNVFGSPHKSHSLDERSSLLNSPKEKIADPKPTLRRITIKNIERGKTEINILESLAGIKLQRTSRNDYKLIEDEEEEEIDELSLFDKMRNYEIYFPHNNFSKQLDPNRAHKRKRRMSDIEMLRNHLGRFFKAMERKGSLEHFQ